jgi:glucose-1-phosphate thymidylyltransferase
MKGIILAGGNGTRLHPMTLGISKQLLPVYDKPMIYYPLSTLILAGLRDVMVISSPAHSPLFEQLLGDGSRYGMSIRHQVQPKPEGLPQAFLIASDFIDDDSCILILGDNLLVDTGLSATLAEAGHRPGATIFGAWMQDPSPYGVVEVGPSGEVQSIEEKPVMPRSHWAIPGLYVYDRRVVEYAASLRPSARGELEIVDLHNKYREENHLRVELLARSTMWLDMGTVDSLTQASEFVRTLQGRQGLLLGSPEEAAFVQGWLTGAELAKTARSLGRSAYADYLLALSESAPS